MRRVVNLACLTAALLVALSLVPGTARAWWNDDWSLRKKIVVDTSAAGAAINDPIGAAVILIRLHLGNFKFEAAKDDGSDLRLVAADDKTPLKYHIERYDGLLGEAFVWVGLPELRPGAQTELWLYYGNKKATAADDPRGTYDADTVLVHHFAERGIPPRDVTSWGNHAQSAGLTADGSLVGPALCA
jgi:biopolymer transport protein ExbB